MATLLNRFKNAAASATTIARSATPTSASTSPSAPPSASQQRSNFVKRMLYTNPVMSVSVVLGTAGIVLPTAVYFTNPSRDFETKGRVAYWKGEWSEHGEADRRERILKELGDRKDDRLDALRQQLQTSAKYTAPQ